MVVTCPGSRLRLESQITLIFSVNEQVISLPWVYIFSSEKKKKSWGDKSTPLMQLLGGLNYITNINCFTLNRCFADCPLFLFVFCNDDTGVLWAISWYAKCTFLKVCKKECPHPDMYVISHIQPLAHVLAGDYEMETFLWTKCGSFGRTQNCHPKKFPCWSPLGKGHHGILMCGHTSLPGAETICHPFGLGLTDWGTRAPDLQSQPFQHSAMERCF